MYESQEVLDRLAGRKDNEAQRLNLELMRIASFNNYDGEKVVKSLLRNRSLWKAVLIDMEGGSEGISLIKLRDLPDAFWNVSTVFILAEEGKEDQLLRIVRRWRADEINWIEERRAANMLGTSRPAKILRVWWD